MVTLPFILFELFSLSETKLFHFHGIFNKNEIKSAKRTPTLFYIWTPFPEILDPPPGNSLQSAVPWDKLKSEKKWTIFMLNDTDLTLHVISNCLSMYLCVFDHIVSHGCT